MKKAGFTAIAVLMYAIGAWFFVFTAWSFVYCYNDVKSAVENGVLVVSENMFDIVRYYMSSCAPYFIHTVVLLVFGFLFQNGEIFAARGKAEAGEDSDEGEDEGDESDESDESEWSAPAGGGAEEPGGASGETAPDNLFE